MNFVQPDLRKIPECFSHPITAWFFVLAFSITVWLFIISFLLKHCL